MTTASLTAVAASPFGALRQWLAVAGTNFRWAFEMKHLCESAEARGKSLDGDTLRQLMREADRRHGPNATGVA